MAKVRQDEENGLSYRGAGVDVSAGNAFIEAIKPLARAMVRTGSVSALGGFGALFDHKAQNRLSRTFNCGIGMIAMARAADSGRVVLELETQGERTVRLGEIAACPAGEQQVRFSGRLGAEQ
jgi:phosphoribosylaminoimidazole (AIR) synthetase